MMFLKRQVFAERLFAGGADFVFIVSCLVSHDFLESLEMKERGAMASKYIEIRYDCDAAAFA